MMNIQCPKYLHEWEWFSIYVFKTYLLDTILCTLSWKVNMTKPAVNCSLSSALTWVSVAGPTWLICYRDCDGGLVYSEGERGWFEGAMLRVGCGP